MKKIQKKKNEIKVGDHITTNFMFNYLSHHMVVINDNPLIIIAHVQPAAHAWIRRNEFKRKN
jgi:hypothetical protein